MARIIIADEDSRLRAELCRILEGEGHTVCDVADGAAAEQADSGTPADIFILDIHMPHRDGLETLRSLRKRGRTAAIIMTAGATCRLCQVDYLPMAERLGADATLRKPFSREAVLGVLARLRPSGTRD